MAFLYFSIIYVCVLLRKLTILHLHFLRKEEKKVPLLFSTTTKTIKIKFIYSFLNAISHSSSIPTHTHKRY